MSTFETIFIDTINTVVNNQSLLQCCNNNVDSVRTLVTFSKYNNYNVTHSPAEILTHCIFVGWVPHNVILSAEVRFITKLLYDIIIPTRNMNMKNFEAFLHTEYENF